MADQQQQSILISPKSKFVLYGILAYAVLIGLFLVFVDKAPVSPQTFLVIGFRGVVVAALVGWRATKANGKLEKATWWSVFCFEVTIPIAVFPAYPNIGDPVGPVYVVAGAIVAVAVVSSMVVSTFRTVSKSRVLLDSVWLTLVVGISSYYVFIDQLVRDSSLSLWHKFAIPMPLLLLFFLGALILNLYLQTSARSLSLPALIGMSFAVYTLAATTDALRVLGVIGESVVERQPWLAIEYLWFVADLGIAIATQIRPTAKEVSALELDRRVHITWFNFYPLVLGAVVLLVTVPSEMIPVVLVGCVVVGLLAVRVYVVGSENRRLSDELQRLAMTDDLTELPNRRALDAELDDIDREADPLVLYVDLDQFKEVNDKYGHDAGDELLKAFSDRLQAVVRDDDQCFRVGGDEFVVMIDRGRGLSEEDRQELLNRVTSTVERVFDLSFGVVSIGMSVGVAGGEDDGRSLLLEADRAMFEAKAAGKGRIRYAQK